MGTTSEKRKDPKTVPDTKGVVACVSVVYLSVLVSWCVVP